MRWSAVLGERPPHWKGLDLPDRLRYEDDLRESMFEGDVDLETKQMRAGKLGFHISCWYIYEDRCGSLAVWHKSSQDYPMMDYREVMRIVRQQDWQAIPDYDTCTDDRCQKAARDALTAAVAECLD